MNSMFKEEKKPRAEKFCEWTPVESLFEKSHREQLQFMWRPADIIYRILSDSELRGASLRIGFKVKVIKTI